IFLRRRGLAIPVASFCALHVGRLLGLGGDGAESTRERGPASSATRENHGDPVEFPRNDIAASARRNCD
ncbi:MAG: hypothetical protein ABUL54_02325, partial [Dongia sp.]